MQIYFNPEVLELTFKWIFYFYSESLNWGNEKLKNYHNKKSALGVIENIKN